VSASSRPAALFDMDRTLVRVNTGNLYVRWRLQRREARFRDLVRVTMWMAQYSLGLVDAARVTTLALEALAGLEEDRMRDDCRIWYNEVVRRHVTARARAEVDKRMRDGYTCAILSASTPYATAPLAADLGIDHVLCTTLEVKDGRFTGDYERPLCYGTGKVALAERWAIAQGVDLDRSVFYTDSVSDLPMLERVGERRIVNPDPRLRLRALVRGWPVERWR